MKLPSLALTTCFVAIPVAAHSLAACGGNSDSNGSGGSGNSTSTASSSSSGPSGSGGTSFPAGTICNATGTPLTPPATLKHIIVILEENKNLDDVKGQPAAPYLNALGAKCGVSTAYIDNCFADNLVSLPHYLALTSGSNCNTGLDQTGTGCITTDQDATAGTLSTTSIFEQVTSWKAYQESMPSACDPSTNGEYATKHNPPPYYSALAGCSANDLPIAAVTCDPVNTNTACTPAPTNAFTQDLANDTLAQLTFITPNLLNEMHDGTVTQADNWLYTYLPLVFQSKAYLRGDVAVMILWDEQETADFGGATPNLFISPYITAGTVSATPINHFSVLRAWENAFGISTYLGCASGMQPGGGACPAGSTADVRAALNW
jgi:acid phosphatase